MASLKEVIVDDLALSGLEPDDIKARVMDAAEKAACGLDNIAQGYVIPYYTMYGRPLDFYRVKVFKSELKYRQLKGTGNHVYFPPNFWPLLQSTLKAGKNYIIVTEGEKKAACAVKHGFPCIAFGGVDSWRNKLLLLPKETEMSTYSYNKQLIGCKVPSGTQLGEIIMDNVAVGFGEIVDYAYKKGLTFIVIYDSDETTTKTSMKYEVQRAASELGFEFRTRGIPLNNIRQLILPLLKGLDKVGLDDLLVLLDHKGPSYLHELIDKVLTTKGTFPRHPNIQKSLNKQLQSARLSRKDAQKLSLNITTDLDCRGSRMYAEEEDTLYYFDNESKKLMKVSFDGPGAIHSPFSQLLYSRYGLSMITDQRVIKWMATQYTGEAPIEEVTPFRVIARQNQQADEDIVRFQINDGQYIKITGDLEKPFEIFDNGEDNILFESKQVKPLDADKLMEEISKRKEEPLCLWWEDVLQEVRLKDHGKTATILSLLYYISPWLHRWRGTQLPLELVIGEAGSGKSTLCELRLHILTGTSNLRNAPSDLKDWHASIANTGGLHVTDNVQFHDKILRQRLSDEICRLITEPEPHIEQRRYYTNTDLVRLRVDSVFSFTGISQPFTASDVLQRAVVVELDKLQHAIEEIAEETDGIPKVTYDSSWKQTQLNRFGGREAWVSHQLYILHRFLAYVQKHWNPNYKAKYRLINLEQCLVLLADMLELESSWIPAWLVKQTDESVVEADWMFEGIVAFAKEVEENIDKVNVKLGITGTQAEKGWFSAKDMSEWFLMSEDFAECVTLNNSRRLARYLSQHKAIIYQITKMREDGKYSNRTMYTFNEEL